MSKRVLAVLGIGLGILVLAMLWSNVNMALSYIQKDLSTSVLELQWGMNAYGIFMTVPLVMMGKLADGYGRKHIFLIGLVLAFISSLLGGFAPHVGLWIACMCIFGLSGSIILPISQALLVHQFPENRKTFAVGLWTVFTSLSLAIGPLVGGTLILFWGWRAVFFVNVLPVIFATLFVLFFVKEDQQPHKPECDWSGVILLATFVASLAMGIMQGPTWGWHSPTIIGLFILTFISLVIFIYLERKSSQPMFRTDLFLQRSFLCGAVPNGCMIGFIWVSFFLIPLHLRNVEGYTAFQIGSTLLLITLPVAGLSHAVHKWYVKFGARPPLIVGFLFLASSALLQALFDSTTFLPLGLACLTLGIGWALVWGPSISAALTSLSHNLAGIASGMFMTLQELGGVIVLAIGGVIYRVSNYQSSFWFLFAVSLFALCISLFLPKNTA